MIHFKNVTHVYPPDVTALRDIHLHVQPGEFVAVVGKSGAGKTTLLRLLIGEEQPTRGEVIVGGWNITDLSPRELPILRRQIGIIFQDFKLLPKKTVYENVAFGLEVVGAPPARVRTVVPQVLDIVGLKRLGDRYPTHISGGEQQRVVIARALVHRPKIIIADEPTGNLDTFNAHEIINILKKINHFGTTVLLVTHNREIVNTLRPRVIMLEDGAIAHDAAGGKYVL